jgi:hypothetical protein
MWRPRSMMTTATALAEGNQPERPAKVRTTGLLQLSQQDLSSNSCRWLEQTAALFPRLIKCIKYRQQESSSLTIPTTLEFNLTKIECNRLTSPLTNENFQYPEVNIRLCNWSPWNLLFESPRDDVMTTSPAYQHRNMIGCSSHKVSWWLTSDCQRRSLEINSKRRYNSKTTVKRRLQISDIVNRLSHTVQEYTLNYIKTDY